MKSIRLGILAAAFALVTGAAALASPAVTNSGVNIRSGPGDNFPISGSIGAGTQLDMGECRDGWCNVVGDSWSGWVAQAYLSPAQFQQQPQPPAPEYPQPQPAQIPLPQEKPWPPTKPRPSQPQPQPQPWPPQPQPQPWPPGPVPLPLPLPLPPVYEEAGACFYSERNLRGTSFCLDQGETLNRLRTWNDSIRSVEVFGGARVDVCTDQNLYGTCATLRRDTGRLPGQLDRNISSIDVY